MIFINTYKQILEKAKEQNIDFDDCKILVPFEENKVYVNGQIYFGRIFDNGLVGILTDVDCPYSENGYISEPMLYQIVNKYETWISHGAMLCKTEFYTIK